MLTIGKEAEFDKQIDRACSAQSADMLPKRPSTPEETAAKAEAIKAHIDAQFERHK